MPITITPDSDRANADWPKRTRDSLMDAIAAEAKSSGISQDAVAEKYGFRLAKMIGPSVPSPASSSTLAPLAQNDSTTTPMSGSSTNRDSYGRCPKCKGKVVSRERRLNGNDRCENGCEYPSKDTIGGDSVTKSISANDGSDNNDDFDLTCEISKIAEHPDYTYILGPVLIPDAIDHQGDVVSADVIEKAAHDYMQDSQRPGLMHKQMLGNREVQIVESYILREPTIYKGKTLPTGTWMAGMRVYDATLRKHIREGRLRGFSIGGKGKRIDEE